MYAPQTNVDKDGRRIMIAWMRMPKAVKEDNGCEWNGMMCQPRVVELENGHIYFRVHPEVRTYFNRQIFSLEKHILSDPFCLRFPMAEGKRVNIGGYRIGMENRKVTADRSGVFGGITGYPLVCSSPEIQGECNLEVFVDRNIVEIFINSGEFVISHIVYGIGKFLEMEGFGEGEISCYCHSSF